LKEIFKQFGPIYYDDTFVKKNGYGFVKFKYRSHAEKAKSTLDGKYLTIPGSNEQTDRPIRVGWGDANTQRNCVHIQFDNSHASQVDLEETDFSQVFSRFGHVVKVSLPRFPDRQLKGYGFIHFEENDDGEKAAARAITTLSNGKINGVTIQCNFGKRQNQRHKRFNKHFGMDQFEEEEDNNMRDQHEHKSVMQNLNLNRNQHQNQYQNQNQNQYQDQNQNQYQNQFQNQNQYQHPSIRRGIGTSNNREEISSQNQSQNQNQTMQFSSNVFSTNGMFPSSPSYSSHSPPLNQFNSLPPGPYLAPPTMYGKTLDALAASSSPSFMPFAKPSQASSVSMVSPPNHNNLAALLSPPNPTQNPSTSDLLLQLSALNQLTNGNNFMFSTNELMQQNPFAATTNFANLVTLLPPTTTFQSSNWAGLQPSMNSVTSLPSVGNNFTNNNTNSSSSINMQKTTNIPQSNLPFNFNMNMNALSFSPPNAPMKDRI